MRQKAYAGARTKIGERLIAEQQAVISNLWHVFALAGLSPAKVCILPQPNPLFFATTPPSWRGCTEIGGLGALKVEGQKSYRRT
jgi:hypothetical protein